MQTPPSKPFPGAEVRRSQALRPAEEKQERRAKTDGRKQLHQGRRTTAPASTLASPEGDDPNKPDIAAGTTDPYDVDISFWEKALADAERAEKDWRTRGREIVQIYRGDIPITRPKAGRNRARLFRYSEFSTFNILYANTEVMLPAAYSKPPDPVVRSRFVKKSAVPPPPPPPIMPPGIGAPGDAPCGDAAPSSGHGPAG